MNRAVLAFARWVAAVPAETFALAAMVCCVVWGLAW